VGINKRVVDRLYSDEVIDEPAYRRAIDYAKKRNMRVEEAIIDLDILSEAKLLKYIATIHKTQFVSTTRMSRAKIDESAVNAVPKGMARHFGVYPLVLDRVNDKLIVATADPDNTQALQELKVAASVERVIAMVARPLAVVAAIERGYGGDRSRFKKLLQSRVSDFETMLLDDAMPGENRARGVIRRTGQPDWSGNLSPREQIRRKRMDSTGQAVTGEYAPPRRTGLDDPDGPPPRRTTRRPDADNRERWRDHDGDFDHDRSRGLDLDLEILDADLGVDAAGPPQELPFRDDDYRQPAPDRRTGRGGRYAAEVDERGSDRGYHEPPRYVEDDGYPAAPRYRGEDHGSPEPRATGVDHEGYPEPPRYRRSSRGRSSSPDRTPLPVDDYAPDGYSLPYDEASAGGSDPARASYPSRPSWRPNETQPRGSQPGEIPGPQPARRPPHIGQASNSMFPRPALSAAFRPLSSRQEMPADPGSVFRAPQYLESLRVFIGLLENERADLRGHSAFVARLSVDIAERISLPEDHAHDIVLASCLHDLGKMGGLHLTALNVAQSEQHLDRASKLFKLPQQLTESVGYPARVITTLTQMYERMGGGGIPEGLAGKDISIGARILAAADSYADLTRNPSNEYGRMLTPDEGLDVLRQQAGAVFDENIIDVLENTTSGEKILTDLLANRHRVLIVDPDPEETMVLQLRLVEQGFDVHVARSSEEATTAFGAREFALVVSEVDLEEPEIGFALREQVAQEQHNMSWVFVSSRNDRETAQRALKLGVDDFIAKPVATEILVAKLMQLVERTAVRAAPRGVSGSLAQMGIPEIVQILWHGQKTCALNLSQGDKSGQIHFQKGQIVNATWGDAVGETAFYRLLALGEDGQFAVDPEFTPADRVIEMSPQGLLLEGMRLLDENAIP